MTDGDPRPARAGLGRRALLVGGALGLGGAAFALSREDVRRAGPAEPGPAAAGHGGHGGHGEAVAAGAGLRVSGRTVLDTDLDVDGLVVESDGILVLDPERDVTITSRGNVVVEGVLEMAPASTQVTHRLVFADVDESAFVGDGMEVLAEDVGLWVVGGGRLRLQGAARTPWTRAAAGLRAGERAITLTEPPDGWQPGDELAITPTASPVTDGHSELYDVGVVASVEGARVVLRDPLLHDHPAVDVPGAGRVAAEVLNLTRNVQVEGTEGGRAHVLIMASVPQQLEGAALRHVGPRPSSEGVLGRYGLHFHVCGDGSRGSTVRSVVVRDCGTHAFVAHSSHGVTFSGCISHDTVDDAYWWDQGVDGHPTGPPTHDTTYERCVASRVTSDPPERGFRTSGFNLGSGERNSAHGCVTVGLRGSKDASGFVWPESGAGVWDFTGNLAHNNERHGIFTWQNNDSPHEIRDFVAYHNGGSGIAHGAYDNGYLYADSVLYGNRESGVLLHSVSTDDRPQRLERLTVDCAGLADYAIEVAQHTLPPGDTTRVLACTLAGYRSAGIAFTHDGGEDTEPDLVDVVDCTFSGNRFWLSDHLAAESVVRVQDAAGSYAVVPAGSSTGTPVPEWNARQVAIEPFRR